MSEENLSAKPIGCWWIHRGSQITCSCSCGETGMCSSPRVVDMERLICRCIDDKFIFHKYVLGRMPSNSCCCCPPASSWVQDLGGARGVTYCGRGSRHYSARGTLTIIWPLSPVSAPENENEYFHSTVSFKLPQWQDSRLQIVMNSFMICNFIFSFSILLLCSSAVLQYHWQLN